MGASALQSSPVRANAAAAGPFAVFRGALRNRRRRPIDVYALRVLWADAALVTAAAVTSYIVVFGTAGQVLVMGQWEFDYVVVTVVVVFTWMMSLSVLGSRHARLIGSGSVE